MTEFDRVDGLKTIFDVDDHGWRSPDTMAQREVDVKRRRAYVTLLTEL
jgi:hypothetical protein